MVKKVTKSAKDQNIKAPEVIRDSQPEGKPAQKGQQAAATKSSNKTSGDPGKMNGKTANLSQQKIVQTLQAIEKLQLGFGSAASELSEKLSLEASRLQEIRESVGEETKQLQELHSLEFAEYSLDNLLQQYEASAKTFVEEVSQRREAVEQEKLEQKKAWDKEQEEQKRAVKERNDLRLQTRQRDTQEYQYDLKQQRQRDVEEYDLRKKGLYKALEEAKQAKEKEWAVREKGIAEREKQFEEAKTKFEAFVKEKEAAIKKGTEEGRGIASYQAKVKADLEAKEVEGQKRIYELRLQSLEQTIQNQEARLASLSKQLESALKQVQDLAVKAIEGASNLNSSQVLKEIALEQAKTIQKSK
ncbi:MAG: hypothetical protein MUC60_13870 [Oscillatoria sp. Prado101]|jgi:hypothetical protein|nr:hypothetical protein [Oscillatoria sp. Prado101]